MPFISMLFDETYIIKYKYQTLNRQCSLKQESIIQLYTFPIILTIFTEKNCVEKNPTRCLTWTEEIFLFATVFSNWLHIQVVDITITPFLCWKLIAIRKK